MKTVKVLICVISERAKSKFDLTAQLYAPLSPLKTLQTLQAFQVQQKHPLAVLGPVSKLEGPVQDSCEDYGPVSQFLIALFCVLCLLMFFAMLDVESGKPGRGQKSLVHVVFVTRTKVTPRNGDIREKDVRRKLSTVNGENVPEERSKIGGKKTNGNGSFKFRRGFLTKKRRTPSSGKTVQREVGSSAVVDSSLLTAIDLHRKPAEIREGNVSVVYKLFNKIGEDAAVFKPYEALKGLVANPMDQLTLNSKQHALNEVCAYKFDQHSAVGLRAGVPETQHVKLPAAMFTEPSDTSSHLGFIRGSVQKFVPNTESCEDYGPNLFTKDDVHRIGLLDLRILNCDRHSGNMLFNSSQKRLIPIDHALSFPSVDFDVDNEETAVRPAFDKDYNNLSLADISFDWLMFPQAKLPFSKDVIEGIKSMNVVKDLETMKKLNMSVNQRLAVFMSSALLRLGAIEYNKTLYELGMIAQRTGARTNPSILEQLAQESIAKVDRMKLEHGDEEQVKLFCEEFTSVLDKYFKV